MSGLSIDGYQVATLGFLAVCAVAGGAWYLGYFISSDAKACEAMIVDILKAPSQYRRVKVSEWTASIDQDAARDRVWDQWINSDTAASQMAEMRASPSGIKQAEILIEYDAPNSYGTMLRGKALCDRMLFTNKDGYSDQTELRFNGTTQLQRMREADTQ